MRKTVFVVFNEDHPGVWIYTKVQSAERRMRKLCASFGSATMRVGKAVV